MKRNRFLTDYTRDGRPPWDSTGPKGGHRSKSQEGRYRPDVRDVRNTSTFLAGLRGSYYSRIPPISPYVESLDFSHRRRGRSLSPRTPKGHIATERKEAVPTLSFQEDHNHGYAQPRGSDSYRKYGKSKGHQDDQGETIDPHHPTGEKPEDGFPRDGYYDSQFSDEDGSASSDIRGGYQRQWFRFHDHLVPGIMQHRGHLLTEDDSLSPFERHHAHGVSYGQKSNFDSIKNGLPESTWRDIEMRNALHGKHYNLLPSLHFNGDRHKAAFNDGYHGKFPLHGRLLGHHRGLWGDISHQDILNLRFLSDARNAELFLESFLESCIRETLVLEVAVEVLVEARELQDLIDQTSHPMILAAKDVLHDCINEELSAIAREEKQNNIAEFWRDVINNSEIMESVTDMIIMVTVEDEMKLVAADAISEMVEDYFQEKHVVTGFGVLYNEVSGQLLYELVNESLLELSMDEIFEELVDEETREVASIFVTEVYATGHPRQLLSDLKAEAEENAVSKQLSEYVTEILILEELLKSLKLQHQKWTNSEYKERTIDGLIFDQLLGLSLEITNSVEITQHNIPLKEFHDDIADQKGMQYLLEELTSSLDDEMDEQDQVEVELARLMDTPSSNHSNLES